MSTPLKKGLGDYAEGEKFTLKSGNSPAFKMMGNTEAGDSPITNEFGIGKGTSPYQQIFLVLMLFLTHFLIVSKFQHYQVQIIIQEYCHR